MKPDTHRFYLPRLHWLLAIPFLALIGVVSIAPGSAQGAERDKIEAFLSITGFDVAMDSIALTASSAPSMLGMPEDEFGGDWKRLAKQVFDKDTMRQMAIDILAATLSDEALAHAAGFYASDLGQRLVVVENASQMMEDDAVRQEVGQGIVDDLATENTARLDMLGRMNRAVHTAESSVDALQEIQIRFLMAANAAGVIELNVDADGLKLLMQDRRGELLEAIRKSALSGAAYVYRDFSDADIKTYTEALEQPLMQEVYQLLNAVQYEIMANRFEALAIRMAELHPAQDI